MSESELDTSGMSTDEIIELQKQNCIFCKIADKEIPAKIIHEDNDVICVLDINPVSEGHILVYPKKHYMILPHVPKEISDALFRATKLMSQTLLRTLQVRGTTIFVANGAAAGQKAPHVLVHVFPRKDGDGILKMPFKKISDEELKKNQTILSTYITKLFGPSLHKKTQRKDEDQSTVEIIPPVSKKLQIEKTRLEPEIEDHQEILSKDSKESQSKDEIEMTKQKNVEKRKPKKDSVQKKSSEQKIIKEDESSQTKTAKNVNLNDIAKLFGAR